MQLVGFFVGESALEAAIVYAIAQTLAPRFGMGEFISQAHIFDQVAAHLALSEKTVRNHITRIFDKIAVENRSQAIVAARKAGLGTDPVG